MMIMITGGSGSGKSAYAEEYFSRLASDCLQYYIATMQVSDKESRLRVQKHRRMRENRGFSTIEQPVQIEQALDRLIMDRRLWKGPGLPRQAALVECLSNLVANEMFSGQRKSGEEEMSRRMEPEERILEGMEILWRNTEHLVVVTNNVFEDGCFYEESTLSYIRTLGRIQQRLAGMADQVIEVVAGIPVFVKGGEKNALS